MPRLQSADDQAIGLCALSGRFSEWFMFHSRGKKNVFKAIGNNLG